jgi:peptidoglycan/LPS O-acetylase OafA/YrhL
MIGMTASDNGINPISVAFLAALILSAAFTMPWVGDAALRRNDISYGIYIYHMPIANLLIWYEVGTSWTKYSLLVIATFVAAIGSWFLIEKPALRRKGMSQRSALVRAGV